MSVEGIQQDAKSNGNGQVETVVGLGQVQQGKQFGITLCVDPSLQARRGLSDCEHRVLRVICSCSFTVEDR
jgi:hypothetical protein